MPSTQHLHSCVDTLADLHAYWWERNGPFDIGCPREPGDRTYLIDWQGPEFEFGALDLANMFATFWSREQCHHNELEITILRRYHARPIDHGVQTHAIDDLIADYRIAVAIWVLVAVHDAAAGSARDYRWPKLQCLLDAFADHDSMMLFHD